MNKKRYYAARYEFERDNADAEKSDAVFYG